MKKVYIIFLLSYVFNTIHVFGQSDVTSSPEVTSSGNGGFVSLSKLYQTSISPIPAGQVFTYQINFSISGSVVDLQIDDFLPAELTFVSELSPSWLTASVNGNTVTWNSIPTGATVPTGAFSINLSVRFNYGETCVGAVASNFASIQANKIPRVVTQPIDITSTAADGWKVRKVVRPANNSTFLTGSTVTYDIYIFNTLGLIGSHNLYNVNITDIIPTGATLISSNISNIPILDVTAANSGNPYISPYHFVVEVEFPASHFPNESCGTNKVNLRGFNPCDQTINESDSVTVCFLDSIPLNPNGYLGKYIDFMENPVAGCSGSYQIGLGNSGNVAVNDFVFDDTFPAGISVNKIRIYNPSGNNYQYTVNGNTFTSSLITEIIDHTTPGITVPFSNLFINNLALAQNQGVTIYIDFSINNSATTGQIIHNEAHLNSASQSISKTASVNFTIQDAVPKIKVRKEICSPTNHVYNPGDEFIYRVGFQNHGSADFLNGTFDDLLDPRLEFVNLNTVKIYKTTPGSYPYTSCSSSGNAPAGTIDLTGSTTFAYNSSGNNFYVNLPDMPHDCDSFIGQGYSLISQLETYWVEFKVRVKTGTPPGMIPNAASVGNSNFSFVSNTVSLTVNAVYQISARKEISTDGGLTYGISSNPVSAGSQIKYRLSVKNVGNVNMTNIKIIDLIPSLGDVNILGCTNRASNLNGTLIAQAQLSSNFSVNYSNQNSPDVNPELGQTCGTNTPGWSSIFANTSKSLKFESNSGFILTPGSTELIYLDLEIPITATTNDLMCNDFVVRAEDMNYIPTSPFSSNIVCVGALPYVPMPCCTSNLEINKTRGGITNVPSGAPWSGGVPLSLGVETFSFQNSSVIPITEVNIRVTDVYFDINNEECPSCNDNPALWGSIDNVNLENIGNPSTGLSFTDYVGTITIDKYNQRELQWKNENGYIIQPGDQFKINYVFPPFTGLSCCKPTATVCTEVSWKDANCQVCTFNSCSSFKLSKKTIAGPGGILKQSVQLNSNSVGLPRLNTEQIEEIEEPETGMILWDIDSGCIKLYNGTAWHCVNLNEIEIN